ncbi:BMC domain-containing protein [Lachnoclostridium sp. Marseille-P6806]|uniref:BMC domain-containing protein n=1 Tax=Lachnoclostridium sp. Marseille-P6806 TaxID=2364793 RepID=UPI00102F3C70|nr:BMC domain-containing protein [Lachnoclostridium sp. Marseille-P6806]
MGRSYGLIEITGVVAAVDALDIMCKAADVTLATWERRLGGRLVTLIVEGDVSACTEAVAAAEAGAIKKPVACGVIANPHEEIVRMVEFSAQRWKKQYAAREELRGAAERETGDPEADSYLSQV